MEYQYKVVLSNRSLYREFQIPAEQRHFKIGTNVGCEFRLNEDDFFGNIELELERREDEWMLSCGDSLYISKGDMRRLLSVEVKHGDVLSLRYASTGDACLELRFLIDFEAKVPQYLWTVDLSVYQEFIISDNAISNIRIDSKLGGGNHVVLRKQVDGFYLESFQSEYGIFHNGKQIYEPTRLEDCDFVSIAGFSFYYKKQTIYFDCHRIVEANCDVYAQENSLFAYPKFIRNTRVKSVVDEEAISILDPADKPVKPEMNLVMNLMPTLVMFALTVVLRGFMSTSGGTFVIFSICTMGMGVITSILSIVQGQRRYKKEVRDREENYYAYIEKKKEEIACARHEELECLRATHYSVEENLRHILTFDPKLFDRLPDDEDFLDVNLGVGRTLAKKTVSYKPRETLEAQDELAMIPTEVYENSKYIENAPVILRMKEANAIGVVGTKKDCHEMFKNMLLDLVARQYYSDLQVAVFVEENATEYDWLRLLPHIFQVDTLRNIVSDNDSKNLIFENLYNELTFRSENPKVKFVHKIIFIMDEHGIKSHPISKFIEIAANLNVTFVFFTDRDENLPLHCSSIVHLFEHKQGEVFESSDRMQRRPFTYEAVSDKHMELAVRKLAPIYCEEISLESSLRKSISLFELLNVFSVNDLDLRSRWNSSRIYETMEVPLGVNVKEEVVSLNLHEKFHGPHGLVAGTTGSGKSEILQSYILGAATMFHPYEIGFVIIDFKGGGMVNQFKDLPHLIGAITNIDGKAIDRSLKSIKAELLKRQTLFAEAGVNHIDKYIKLFKEKKVEIALPHLVIIVDEFAELKAEQPDFMKELISAARIGRSLGVHLILATQKPAGQVNEQIWSNSKFKLCLKVQTPEDSNEVLKSPLAAEIREPGRAYLQVGNNEIFELFQSGFSGAPEKTDDTKQKSFQICSLDRKGAKKVVFAQKPEKANSSRTQLEAVVDYVNQYCERNHIARLQQICLPALSTEIMYSPVDHKVEKTMEMVCPIGTYDDPDNQFQGMASVTLGNQNTLILGSSQYGKTNLLEVMIHALAQTYSPDELHMYLIDFGSMVLKNFEKLHHVGGVVTPSEDEKLKNLFKYLHEQVEARRKKMLDAGVSSFLSYKEAGNTDLAQIIVFIDNLTALKELYLADNDVLLNLCREGISVGITFVISNAQTTGMGYKYMSNFATRIALFCNEPGEYMTLFGACKMRPDETPGRCLMEIDKNMYECQTFLAFEGEKEYQRVEAMQESIRALNERYPDSRATLIPEIPEVLVENYLLDNFKQLVLGLNYETVMPIPLEYSKNNMLSIVGREESGKANFMQYLVHAFVAKQKEAKVVVFDNYKKKLADLKATCGAQYNLTADNAKEVICGMEAELASRYEALVSEKPYDETFLLLVINNEDVIAQLSTDKECAAALKNITGKYKMLGVFVVFGNIPNAPVAYGAPEVYKMIKDMRHLVFFDDLENCKVVDIPMAVLRNNKKKIALGDGYYVLGNDCMKMKTPLAKNENS